MEFRDGLRSLREKTESTFRASLLQPIKQRRLRTWALVVVTFFLVSATWTYYSLMLSDGPIVSSFKSPNAPKVTGTEADSETSLIPKKIWQIIFKDDNCDPEDLRETKSWLAKNMNYQYTLMGKQRSDEFVYKHYADEPRVIEVYESLKNTGMKSDLLRYLILNIEGGVYTDIDTVAIRPIDQWVPSYLRGRIRLIAGIEFDQLDGPRWQGMHHHVQFGQWTFAGAPGHPVFRALIDRAVKGIEELAKSHNQSLKEFRPTGHVDVVNSTGPIAFTDMIVQEIQKTDPDFNDTKVLSPMTENVVIGDMLLLPIDGFGMGQQHSGSTHDGSIPKSALVQHQFWGHWGKGDQIAHKEEEKEDKPKGDKKKEDS